MMPFSITHWTPDEDALLIERMGNNERISQIARTFPKRTEKSVLSRAAKLRGSDNRDFDRAKARNSSKKLARAINRLFDRMKANEVASVIGKPHLVIPGTERIYKTASVERLAA